jgi:hypothetical protein
MVIESSYWKQDLLKYANKFKPQSKPERLTERRLVNFEKDLVISLFMVRVLAERHKFSSKIKNKNLRIFRSRCIGKVTNLNHFSIEKLYDFDKEELIGKSVTFVCNQVIHHSAMFAYRDKQRNWGGVITSSDYERDKYMYRIPLAEVISLLRDAAKDYPSQMKYEYCDKRKDYIVTTD